LGRRAAVSLLLALGCWTGCLAAQARADELFNVGQNPVVDVTLGTGTVTVQTWDRPQVQVSGDGAVNVEHLDASSVDPNMQRVIPGFEHTIQTVHGPVTLPPEPFVLPQLPGRSHDEVRASGNGNTVVNVPRGTALVMAHVDFGRVTLNNYRGAFVTQVHTGGVFLNHVSGTGYAESLRGRIVASNSTFDRLRARTAMGYMSFDRCTSHQIEATSSYGSITYNNGSFEPGLARFESEHGNVALGVRGGAQIGAHTDAGRVTSSFSNGTQVRGNPNTAQAFVGGGGPVVTATSRDGSVYLYNGSIESHPEVRAQMRGEAAAGASMGGARFAPQPIFRPVQAAPVERMPQPQQFRPQQPQPQQFRPQQPQPPFKLQPPPPQRQLREEHRRPPKQPPAN
jgi:hypothetical protein